MRNKIKLIMERENMTQQEFAQRLKISPASLSSIFTGRTNPTNTHVMAIHKAFPGINISWLLFDEGGMYSDLPADENSLPGNTPCLLTDDCQNGTKTQSQSLSLLDNGENVKEHREEKTAYPSAELQDRYPGLLGHEKFRVEPEKVRIIDKKRSIKEIRVFYDDGTYESFVPSSK